MSYGGASLGEGLRFIFDNQQRFAQVSNGPVYLVIRNYTDQEEVNSDAEEMGFTVNVAPSGAPAGTTNVLIDPPPTVKNMNMTNLGMAATAAIKVTAGSKQIVISHTFVLAQMAARGFSEPRQVFEDDTTVGILVGGVLMDIQSATSRDALGSPLTWAVIGTAVEEVSD